MKNTFGDSGFLIKDQLKKRKKQVYSLRLTCVIQVALPPNDTFKCENKNNTNKIKLVQVHLRFSQVSQLPACVFILQCINTQNHLMSY